MPLGNPEPRGCQAAKRWLHSVKPKPRDRARRHRCSPPRNENPRLQQQSATRRGYLGLSRPAAHQGERAALFRHGGICRDSGKRPRRGCLCDPIDLLSGKRPLDGAACQPGCAKARFGAAGDRGHPLLRLRPARSEIRSSYADLGKARRQHDYRGGRRSRADARPSRRTDPGVFRYSDRQSLRIPGAGEGYPGQSSAPGSCHGLARCRRGRARAPDRPPCGRRPRHHR